MTDGPFPGAFRHQHGDPRSLCERIEAQIRERIDEAVEMAGLELLVELRRRDHRPAPEEGNARDREEFRAMAESLLAHLDQALRASLSEDERQGFERARAADADARGRMLSGQVFLAKRLPDYWQRFEVHRAAFAERGLGATGQGPGWLKRLFAS